MKLFSIIHTSARPDKWREIYEAWMRTATDPASVEYILVVDKRWGFEELPTLPAPHRAVWNTGRRCYVDGVNIGAQYATGVLLIVNADDQYPCQDWDFLLAEVFADSGKEVIEVSTGTQQEHERKMLAMPVLNRARYDRLGYVFFPAYESMYADNDLCEAAIKDDQLADARHLMFPHKHPLFDESIQNDIAYQEQNSPRAYEIGARVFMDRQSSGFGQQRRKTIVICLPGEKFSSAWVAHLMGVMSWMQSNFNVIPILSYSSNVHVTRACLAVSALKNENADYVLWIDDDNLIMIENVSNLIADLECIPAIDIVAGWCHLQTDAYEGPSVRASVGMFDDNGDNVSMEIDALKNAQELIRIDWTGFPIVLMRREALAKVDKPFAPLMNDKSFYGFDSEDIAFCKRAKAIGLNIAVDPRVKVPHLKLRDADSTPAKSGILTEGR